MACIALPYPSLILAPLARIKDDATHALRLAELMFVRLQFGWIAQKLEWSFTWCVT